MTARTRTSITTSITVPPLPELRSVRPQLTVPALEEEQWTGSPPLGVLHLADVDHVIPALVGLDDPPLDVGERALEHGHAVLVRAERQAAELLAARLGEVGGQLLLILCQDVHHEAPRVEEGRMGVGGVCV